MKYSIMSFVLARAGIVLFLLITLNNFGFSQDILEITTKSEQDTLFFNYSFNFSGGAPSSIIAIEKPEDSIFINAIDSRGNEYEPLVIGDFYRFEIDDRDITKFETSFTSDTMYQNILTKNELLLYVNSNIDLDRVIVNLDVVRDFDEVSDIFPRNYKYNKSMNTITITQNGILEDNLFKINYTQSGSADLSFWLIVMLSLPIAFFLILFAILKVKPYTRDKKLDEYISDKEDSENKNNSKKTSQTSSSTSDTASTTVVSTMEDNEASDDADSFVYSYQEEGIKNQSQIDDEKNNITSTNNNLGRFEQTNHNKEYSENSYKKSLSIDENSDKNIRTSEKLLTTFNIKNEELENYIKKYFTENEQDVIRTIHNKEGIVQQEILDVLPIFTKSTLSKILTKLEGKKMIERVRVGKINKLYIGEKLKKLISNELANNENS